jgi:serine/threonine protein kinase
LINPKPSLPKRRLLNDGAMKLHFLFLSSLVLSSPVIVKRGNLTDYEVVQYIDSGVFGTVFKAVRKSDGLLVAVKRIDHQMMAHQLIREVKLLRQLSETFDCLMWSIVIFPLDVRNEELFAVYKYKYTIDGWFRHTFS